MSQAELLDEISEWTAEICLKELHSTLPRLLSLYQSSDNWIEQMRVLGILTGKFLPHIGVSELEKNFFSQVIPKAAKLFDELLCELCCQASDLTSMNIDLQNTLRNILQMMVQGLEALTACVHHVCMLEVVEMATIQTLPCSLLHVLQNTFKHCRDSEMVYSGHLHLVSDLLQSMFKQAVFLHKQLMELLDKICIDASGTEEEIEIMVSVLHTVLDLCAVISSMDHALHANTWKFIIKQSLKHQASIESQLRHSNIIAALSDDILVSYHSCLQLAEQMALSDFQETSDHRLFKKTVKLCRFFANSLVHYTKEFMPFLSESCCRLHQLYLQIYSKFPPSLYASTMSETHKDEMVCIFLIALDPLIDHLLCFRPFVEQVLRECLELPSEMLFPQCLLLIHVMGKLPSQPEDVQNLWCTGSCFQEEISRLSIFKAIFSSVMLCSAELSLPVRLQVMVKGHTPAEVTFYQFVCVHFCAYIASILPSHFSYLERALLEAVLSSSMLTSVLAMDLWCFLARYGTAELCAHHVFLLAQLIKSCSGHCWQIYHLSVLLRRLLFLMASDHQAEFIASFPPAEAENLPVWQHLCLKALMMDVRNQVANDIISIGVTQCNIWRNGRFTLGNLEQLNTILSAFLTICNIGEVMETELQSAVSEVVGQIWMYLHLKRVSCQPYLKETFSLLLPLMGIHAKSLSEKIVQVVSLQTTLLHLDPPDHLLFEVLHFLIYLGKHFIPQELQSQVLPKVSTLFANLMSNQCWLIHQHALEAFTQFAEETSHEEVVPQSLGSEEIKSKVVSFLNKTNILAETQEARLERIKQEMELLHRCFAQRDTSDNEEGLTTKPSAKRARREHSDNELYESEVKSAEGALNTLQTLMQKSPAPDWLLQRLQDLQELLTSLKSQIS